MALPQGFYTARFEVKDTLTDGDDGIVKGGAKRIVVKNIGSPAAEYLFGDYTIAADAPDLELIAPTKSFGAIEYHALTTRLFIQIIY